MPARRPVFFAVALAALAGGLAGQLTAANAQAPTLLRDVRTGYDLLGSQAQPATPSDYIQPDTQIEPSIDVNPNNQINAIAVYQEGRVDVGGDATNGYATTFDAGRSWVYGEVPGLTSYPGQTGPFDRASDAVVAFGPSNDAYYSSLVFDDTTGNALRSGMAINVSKNGGATWSQPVFFADDQLAGLNDKNWVVVDQSNAAGHHQGRVYVVWDRVAAVFYDYCDSGCDSLSGWAFGGTFQKLVLPSAYTGQAIGATPLVLNDGSLAVIFDSAAGGVPVSTNEQAIVNTSTSRLTSVVAPLAGTQPFGTPLVFEPPVYIANNGSVQPRSQRAASLPGAAYDRKTGTIYVSWEDARNHTEATPENDAFVSSSTDGGLTWSTPTQVNPSSPTDHIDRYNVSVSTGADGVVHVAYRQRQEADDPAKFSVAIDTMYQESSDGGKTWTAPLRVNLVADDARYGAFSRLGTFQGDYNGIATSGAYTYVVRAESYPTTPGEPVALTLAPTSGQPDQMALTGKGHTHQQVWVAVLGPRTATVAPTPETSAGQPGEGPAVGLANTGAVAGAGRGALGGAAGVLLALGIVAARARRRPRRLAD